MRFKTVAVLLLAVCLLAGQSDAQTHPCDQPAPTNATIQSGAPYKAQFCSKQADKIEAVVGFVDGQAFDLLPVTAKTGPSATGLILYESPPFIQVAKGAHVLEVATYNRNLFTGQLQLGPKSPGFPFAADDDTPISAAPAIKGVAK